MLRPSLCFRMSRCRPRSRAAGLRDTFDSPSLCGECASKCRPRTAQYRGSAGSRWLCFLGSRSKRASPTSRASYSCKKSASCSIFEAEPSPMPKLSWFKNSSDRFTSSWLLFRARRTGTEPLSNKDHDRSIAIASVFPFEAGEWRHAARKASRGASPAARESPLQTNRIPQEQRPLRIISKSQLRSLLSPGFRPQRLPGAGPDSNPRNEYECRSP